MLTVSESLHEHWMTCGVIPFVAQATRQQNCFETRGHLRDEGAQRGAALAEVVVMSYRHRRPCTEGRR